MPACFARAAFLALALLVGVKAASADSLADFNAAVEKAAAHNRVALGYLRTGNIDLASLEIDRLRQAWGSLVEQFRGKQPEVFAGNPLYGVTLTGVNARLVAADLMLKTGHADGARQSLNALRDDLYKLRKSAGIVALADCVHDANAAMDALMVYNDAALDQSKPEIGSSVASKAAAYGDILNRCDGIASNEQRQSPEFRRLVDGAKASLTLIPKAVATNDTDLLHRVLSELRSLDYLLAFRFG